MDSNKRNGSFNTDSLDQVVVGILRNFGTDTRAFKKAYQVSKSWYPTPQSHINHTVHPIWKSEWENRNSYFSNVKIPWSEAFYLVDKKSSSKQLKCWGKKNISWLQATLPYSLRLVRLSVSGAEKTATMLEQINIGQARGRFRSSSHLCARAVELRTTSSLDLSRYESCSCVFRSDSFDLFEW